MRIIKSEEELPWPKKGDSIFTPSNKWQYNACFHFTHEEMHLYIDGYLRAAEILVNSVCRSARRSSYIDAKVYPILFLYHHHIELQLKNIIYKGNILLNKNERFPQHHKIYELWLIAKKIICKVNENSKDRRPVNIAEKVIKELATINNDAEGYRYPYDKDGNLLLKDIKHLNLDTLRKVMGRITTFLDAVSEQIYVYLDYKQEMENNF
ncbi:MAG: hypothetical protein PHR44_02970 [Candidatus Omnitrophica bacterium]|nr:hypothetical protein [Candidatus Omnitrophota bacterium]